MEHNKHPPPDIDCVKNSSKKRSRYSTLPNDKKEEIRAKRRQAYKDKKLAAQKASYERRADLAGTSSGKTLEIKQKKRSWFSTLSDEKKEVRRKNREAYHRKKQNLIIKQQSGSPSYGLSTQLEYISGNKKMQQSSGIHIQKPKGIMTYETEVNKGKTHVSVYSSFEIGPTSSPLGNLDTISYNKIKRRPRGYKKKTTGDKSKTFSQISIPTSPSTLPQSELCKHCGAKKFYAEPKGFCCCDGWHEGIEKRLNLEANIACSESIFDLRQMPSIDILLQKEQKDVIATITGILAERTVVQKIEHVDFSYRKLSYSTSSLLIIDYLPMLFKSQ